MTSASRVIGIRMGKRFFALILGSEGPRVLAIVLFAYYRDRIYVPLVIEGCLNQ
jgi:hypothetical protein